MTNAPSSPEPTLPRPSRVVVLADDAEVGDATTGLFALVRGLRRAGVETEVVLVRHGPLLDDLRSECSVKVVDDLTRSVLDRSLRLARLGTVGGAIKGRRVRAWLRDTARSGTLAVVRGPAAARLLRQLPGDAPVVVELEPGTGPSAVLPTWRDERPGPVWFAAPDEAARAAAVAEGVPADRVVGPVAAEDPTASDVVPVPVPPTRVCIAALDAQRGSDNYVLLSVLRWLREAGIPTEVLLWRHGPLLEEMRGLCRVRVVDDLTRSPIDRVLRILGLRMVANRVTGARLRRWLWQQTRRYPSIWVRGVEAARIVRSTPLDARVVVQLAEGEPVGPERLGDRDWALVLDRVAGFVSPTEAGRAALVTAGVPADRIRVQGELDHVRSALATRPGAPARAATPASTAPIDDATRRRRRAALGVPEGAVLIGSTGTHDWWKAPEPIVAFAWALRRLLVDRDVHFLWLCHDLGDEDGLWPLHHDIENAGLSEVFHVVEADTLFSQLGLCDLLVLAGRPDAFAMVRAELAMWARPVVCYRNGVTEVALGGGALPVDYLDVEALAAAVAEVLDDPERLGALAEHAERVRLDDFDADLPCWLATVMSLDEATWVGGPTSGGPDPLPALLTGLGR